MFLRLFTVLSLGLTLLCMLMIHLSSAQQYDMASRHEPPIASMLPEGDVTADIIRGSAAGISTQDEETIQSGKVDFSIASDGKVFRFWTDGKLPLLESTTIDADKNWVKLGDHHLEYAGKANSQDEDGLPNNWRGYRWSVEIAVPSDDSPPDGNITTAQYTVILGLLRITGQTFLHIRVQEKSLSNLIDHSELAILF